MKDYVQEVIDTFASSKYSKEMGDEVYRWLLNGEHSEEKETALQNLWSKTEGKLDAAALASLRTVYAKIETGKTPRKHSRFSFRRYVAAASVALLLVVSTTYWLTRVSLKSDNGVLVEQYIPDGEMRQVILPDSSRVFVNSGTVLFYPTAFKGDTRTVYLVGEAVFDVKKDSSKPFIVRSAGTAVTALGTKFNVSAYPEETEVVATLIQGKVRVDCGETGNSYVLHPGQQVVYNRETYGSVVKDADLEEVIAWQRGHTIFRGCTMEEILRTLERRFGVTFQYNSNMFADDKYNFSFAKGTDIAEVLEVIREVSGKFVYRIDGNVCYMKFNK